MSTILRDLFLLGACDAPTVMTLTSPSPFFPSFSPPSLSPAPRPLPRPPLPLSLCLFLPLSPPSSLSCVFSKRNILYTIGEFPGSPVVRALRLHRRGAQVQSLWGTKILQAMLCRQKIYAIGRNPQKPFVEY